MNHKLLGFLLISALATQTSFAQNEIDALRYGQISSGATARSIGLGGAAGSFGGDFSSLSTNPAGIGVYRSSELMITPTLRFNKVNGTYFNNKESEDHAKMTLNNFGVVFTNAARGENYSNRNWKAVSFGIGYNRVADFNHQGYYSGTNSESSITDIFSADASQNGLSQDLVPPFGFMAYNGFLLYDDLSSIPRNTILDQGGSLQQTKSWKSSGGIDDWSISFGGNYQEKLLLGASIGLVSYKFDRDSRFEETDETGNHDNDFDRLVYNEYLSTAGFGFNLKLGAIFVVNETFRFGAAVHTPTWTQFVDQSDYDLLTDTENLKFNSGQTSSNPITFTQPDYPYEFNYSYRSPWRAVISATGFFGTNGFITADYEYVDYASMKFSFDGFSSDYERSVNNAIKDTYKAGHIFRLGVEGRKDNFLGRLGFAYHSSPFERAADFNGERIDFSAGVGARFGIFFMDLAYMHSLMNVSEFGYPMLASGVSTGIADLKYGNNQIALTLGYKF